MSVFRKILVYVVLASYLFANTLASSWHDHGECRSHSESEPHHATADAKPDGQHKTGKKCCHHHRGHGHKQMPAACQSQGPNHDPTRKQDGGRQRDSHHCVVCDFLAIAPLAAPQVALVTAVEALPEFLVLDVLAVSDATIETHLARGPPAV